MQQFSVQNRKPALRVQRFRLLMILAIWPSLAWTSDSSRNTQADVLAIGLPIAAYTLTGLKKDKQGAWQATKSLGLTVAATLTLNALIDKDTPTGDDNDAFPSGHSAVAFSSAAFMQRRYGWRTGLPAYAVASYVGWLRVKTDEHDWIDVLGGAALGIASSTLFTNRWSDKVALTPWIGPHGAGLVVSARW
jgi:membrane-associated phospholipid phosphatase